MSERPSVGLSVGVSVDAAASLHRTVWQYHDGEDEISTRGSFLGASASSFPFQPTHSASSISLSPSSLHNTRTGDASDLTHVVGYLHAAQKKPTHAPSSSQPSHGQTHAHGSRSASGSSSLAASLSSLPPPTRRSHSAPPAKHAPSPLALTRNTASNSHSHSHIQIQSPHQSQSQSQHPSQGQSQSNSRSLGNLPNADRPHTRTRSRSSKREHKWSVPSHQQHTEAFLRASSPMRANSSMSNPIWHAQNAVSQRNNRKPQADTMDWAPVLFMLKSSHSYMQRHALAIVATLSLNPENHPVMIASQLIAPLIKLANSSDSIIRKDACQTIAHLALTDDSHDQLLESNGLALMVRLVNDADIDLRKLVLEGLLRMVQRQDFADLISSTDALWTIMQTVRCSYPDLRRLAALIFRDLSKFKTTSSKLVFRGIFQEFNNLLKTKDQQVRSDMCVALGIILSNGNFTTHAIECDLHASIVNLLNVSSRDGREDNFFVTCLDTLREFCSEDSSMERLMELNVHTILIDAIKSRNMDVQRQGVSVMASMTSSEKYCSKLVADEKTLIAVLNLGFSNHKKMKRGVALIVRRLIEARHENVLLEKNVVSLLVILAKVFDHDVQTDVAYALSGILLLDGMPEDERGFQYSKLVRIGVVEALSSLSEIEIKDIKLSLAKAISVMCDYIQDFDRSVGQLVSALMKLAHAGERDVNNYIVHSFYMLSCHGVNVRPICDQGGITFLRKVHASRDLSPEFSEDVFRALDNISKDIESRK